MRAAKLLLLSIYIACIGCHQTQVIEMPNIKISHQNLYSQVDKIAVIIEPRKHELLIPIVQNALTVLDKEWKIQIFHGTDNEAFIANSVLKYEIAQGRIFMSSLGVDNITQPQYSKLMLMPYFWENVLGENILIFQTDSILCGSSSKKIDDFLKFDYVGAPYDDHVVGCFVYRDASGYRAISERDIGLSDLIRTGATEIQNHRTFVGNGGLSLRKRSKTLDVLLRFRISGSFLWFAEDDYYSCIAQDVRTGMVAADLESAKTFSVGGIYQSDAFGVHQPWTFLNKQDIDSLANSCQEYRSILRPYYGDKEKRA